MIDDISPALHEKFEIHEWRHASAIMMKDFPGEWADVVDVLGNFVLKKTWITVGGKNKSDVSAWIDGQLTAKGWEEKKFETSIKVDNAEFASPTHKVDCFKNKVGLEIEWNNKDPFFDRDLNNFRLLFELRALSDGIILTKCDELQTIFAIMVPGLQLPEFRQSTEQFSFPAGGDRSSTPRIWTCEIEYRVHPKAFE